MAVVSKRDIYLKHYQHLQDIMVTRFKWNNFPKGDKPSAEINARFFELTLFEKGSAASFFYETTGNYVCTPINSNGRIDIYNIPTKLICYSPNGMIHESIETDKCPYCFNRWTGAIPDVPLCRYYANLLTEIDIAIQTNIVNTKIPVLLLCDEMTKKSIKEAYRQAQAGMPALAVDKQGFENLTETTQWNFNVPYITDKLQEAKRNVIAEFLQEIGINNVETEKKERMITSEANANNEVISHSSDVYLVPRQDFCDRFNKLYGTNVSVEIRKEEINNVVKSQYSDYTDSDTAGQLAGV